MDKNPAEKINITKALDRTTETSIAGSVSSVVLPNNTMDIVAVLLQNTAAMMSSLVDFDEPSNNFDDGCVRKCCPLDHVFARNRTCIFNNQTSFDMYADSALVYGHECPEGQELSAPLAAEFSFSISSNGSLTLWRGATPLITKATYEYCIDFVDDFSNVSALMCSNVEHVSVATCTADGINCDDHVDITDGQRVGTNIIKDGITYTQNDYFTSGDSIRGCICNLKKCVGKCCADGQTLNLTTSECLSSASDSDFSDFSTYHIIVVPPNRICEYEGTRIILDETEDDFQLIDGVLVMDNVKFGMKNFCLSEIDGAYFAVACVINEDYEIDRTVSSLGCNEKFCARKCCKMGYVLTKKLCVKKNDTNTFKVPVYSRKTNFRGEIERVDNFIIGVPVCPVFHLNNSDPSDVYYLQHDGRLWVPNQQKFYPHQSYCIDELDGLSAFICFDIWTLEPDQQFNVIGMIISMPCLLLTFLVYAILPETSLHRRALMSYVLTLLVGYILIVTVQLNNETIPSTLCQLIGYSIIFSFTVSFCWMNVMCVDMWLAFSGMKGFNGNRGTEKKRFIIYCLYAWGAPLLHVIIVFLINTYGDMKASYHPGIGDRKCFVEDGLPNLYYFYLPMAIIIMMNIVLFILTTVKIQRVKKETSMLKHTDSKRHSYEDDKQKFNLYLKLMLAMGINWSMELISWAVAWKLTKVPTWIWYLTDCTNALYGLVIFLIFVCKKKIWISLKKRYYVWMGKPHLAHALSTSTRSGTRSSTLSTKETGVNSDYRLSDMQNGREEGRALNRN